MKKINEILAVVILSLMAVLVAAVGLRIYDTYITNSEIETQIKKQEQVLARNREANDRVQEMRQEIQELSADRERLEQFLEELRLENQKAVQAAAQEQEPGEGGMSGNESMSDNGLSVSGDGLESGISENAAVAGEPGDGSSLSENGYAVSENDAMPGSGYGVSGNDAMSGSGYGVSGNDTMSGNGFSMSGNDSMSANGFSMSGNGTVSGNMPGALTKLVRPEITLEERRQIRSSLEETFVANEEDQICLENRRTDFSGKKIACLGDSITAAANLEGEAGYLSYSYPSVLKELLGAEEVYNLGIGGSSIGRYWSDAFVERYKQIPEDTNIIIVMGGTNDGFCLSEKEFGNFTERRPWTFCGDLDELMRGLKENYPDADIFFVTPLPNILQDYLMRERTYLLPQKNVADVILTLSAAYDFRVIDLYNSNILDSHDADVVADYMPDGVHANKAGYRILAEHIAAELVRYYEQAVCS